MFTKHRSKMPIEVAMSEVMQRFVAGVRRAQIAFFVAFTPGLNLRVGEFSLWLPFSFLIFIFQVEPAGVILDVAAAGVGVRVIVPLT